jgi:hypothetical protein
VEEDSNSNQQGSSAMSSYLFILCPPYSGSTVLWRLLATSTAVSVLPEEGQFLPELIDILRDDPWKKDKTQPWEQIKPVWDNYWDHEKAYLVEKSPPHLIRTEAISTHFQPISFLIMVRNPYAHCEGLMRRNDWPAAGAARFSTRVMRRQMENAENYANSIKFTYETLVETPEAVVSQIQAFLPGIGELKHAQDFKIHSIDGVVKRKIQNLNQKKINNLSIGDIKAINAVLRENLDVLEYWGYELLDPEFSHQLTYVKTKVSGFFSTINAKAKRGVQKMTQSR